ncbi:MAG TPA: hypothetical protein VGO21_05850 [Candidatus Paceibacterota bacterium]|jgi:hypothetical protein|nr:hypothetical protein [Candidatus Paceibacterota bacterium]
MQKKKDNSNKINKYIKLIGDERIIDCLERIGVGFLYASTKLGQNDIAQIMGMGDARVNSILKGIKKS